MLFELLHVFNGTSDFHYSKPTPFELSLQAVGTAIRHILRHTGRSEGCRAALRHTTSMPVKYGGGSMRRLRIRLPARLEWLMTTTPARATARLITGRRTVIGPLPGAYDRAVVTDMS